MVVKRDEWVFGELDGSRNEVCELREREGTIIVVGHWSDVSIVV
jgi:hypothetical protein